MARGKVYLVGAGPGDPKLLTVRGQELLRRADVVVYDHLVSPRLLKECSPKARVVYVGKEIDPSTRSSSALGTRSGFRPTGTPAGLHKHTAS